MCRDSEIAPTVETKGVRNMELVVGGLIIALWLGLVVGTYIAGLRHIEKTGELPRTGF